MRQARDTTQQSRFKDAPWFPKNNEICLVGGAGGIGSWLTFFLTKIGFRVNLYDFDTVEDHNLGGQLFMQADLGKPKVTAIQNIVRGFCDNVVATFNEPINRNTHNHYYSFSAFDNMEARRILFMNWKDSWGSAPNMDTPIFIDGRLEIEQLQIFCVTPKNADKYEREHLFHDSAVEEAPCTMKQTSHTAAMIGSLMTAFFTNHITNVYLEEVLREVPFYYEFVVPMNFTQSEI
jgi:molybdopterin/thiamine biosynthesis adenylyltransferase